MNPEMITYLTQNLMKEAQIIANKFRNNGQNISDDILATKLTEYLTQMNYEFQNKNSYDLPGSNLNLINDQQNKHSQELLTPKINSEPMTNFNSSSSYTMSSEQQNIDWYFIKPYATYYQDTNINHSHLASTYNNQLNSKKLVVNVINDKSSLKSNKIKKKIKKKLYSPSNTIIGSQTIEDLFQVINNQKSKSLIKRVVIIDRYNSDSIISNNKTKQLQTFLSTPITTNTISIIPTTEYMIQQPTNNIYLTTTSYITNVNNYYPFVYYQY